jgi:butyryl-CoA dehydrogenase
MQSLAGTLEETLLSHAEAADTRTDWPEASWQKLREAGVLRWSVPSRFGGDDRDSFAYLSGTEQIGGACLTSAFILSQRDAAIGRLLAYPVDALRERYLPGLARGDLFMTVGLSQLTTSRQHRPASLQATPLAGRAYRLHGEIPWVSGADRADAFVIGATLADGRQLLIVLPAQSPGVSVDLPMPLAALVGSRTSSVRCLNVVVEKEWVLAGPEEHVLGKSGGGGLETSCLALGLAGAAIDEMRREAGARPDLVLLTTSFETARLEARQQLRHLATSRPAPEHILDFRVVCTRLALRATQALLAISKGTGFVSPHPAQRWARQALFFLVWSCPQPAAKGILAELAPEAHGA